MNSEPGSTIGPYKITRELGRGGMGVVYLGHDPRLDREVAIKALPAQLARDPERLARFEQEAKTLAQLDHQNVAGIYGLEELEGKRYLVLEYVAGETLADRLDRGALDLDEALKIGSQIAAGIEAAHKAGIVHRDLKPGNVMITPEGRAKVLDFGLARTEEPSLSPTKGDNLSASPTLTAPPRPSPTMPGAVLGTAAYMSPEQARGRAVDKRTDIWSFAVVLFECLTGISPFEGETATDSIAATLHKQPDWSLLPDSSPTLLKLLLRRCLTKDPDRRQHDIADVRLELEEIFREPDESAPALASSSIGGTRPGTGWGVHLQWVVAVAVGALIASTVAWFLAPRPDTRVRRFEIAVQGAPEEDLRSPVISPDGRVVTYSHRGRLWIRDLESFESRELAGTEAGLVPFWSPDSEWIGFARANMLMKVRVSGGLPEKVSTITGNFASGGSGAWLEDDTIVYTNGNSNLKAVSSLGGKPTTWLDIAPGDKDFHDVSALPNCRGVLFTVHPMSGDFSLAASDGSRRTAVFADRASRLSLPRYVEPGFVLFNRSGANHGVWAVPFSLETLETTGEAFLIASRGREASASADGTLSLLRNAGGQDFELAWMPIDGSEHETIDGPWETLQYPELSPDGTRVAYLGGGVSVVGVWILDLESGSRRQITDGSVAWRQPEWSPDGSEIAASLADPESARTHFFASDGSGQTRDPLEGLYPSFDPDWTVAVVYRADPDGGGSDIWVVPLDGAGEARPLVATSADEDWARLSPDGAWLLYVSDETGMDELYVTRFPNAGESWQVSNGGGGRPEWGPDSDRFYYVSSTRWLMEVTLDTAPHVRLGAPREILALQSIGLITAVGYDVPPPGDRILGVRRSSSDVREASIGVIENWFEEFRGR